MGGWYSMEESLKKSEDNMARIQTKNMEREVEVQNQLLQKQLALQIAGSRETFHWIATFYITAFTILVTGYRKSKNITALGPLLPLTFVTVYYFDLGYGNKVRRIKLEGDNILANESDTLNLPGGMLKLPPLED